MRYFATAELPLRKTTIVPKPAKTLTVILAKAAITLAAIGFFVLLRPDIGRAIGATIVGYPARVKADYRQSVSTPKIIARYLAQHKPGKLQLGAGPLDYEGWLNTDIEPTENQAYLDATKPFPLPDGSFRYVFSEHVIEHLTYEEAFEMLKETHRVLVPGGKVRIATPNLEKLVALFADPESAASKQYIAGKLKWHAWPDSGDPAALVLNGELRSWGHQFVYTPKLLRSRLESVGFTDVREYAAGESDDPAMRGLESRTKLAEKEINAYETMAIEAVRK